MGLGCERDPFEANAWYVRAADQGDIRAKQRVSTIRAADGFDVDEGPLKGKKRAGTCVKLSVSVQNHTLTLLTRTDDHRPKWLGIF